MGSFKKKINILYIDPTQGTGGATKSLLSVLAFIDKSRFNTFLIVHRKGPFTSFFEKLGVIHCKNNILLMKELMFNPNLLKGDHSNILNKCLKLVGLILKTLLIYKALFFDYINLITVIIVHKINLVHFNAYSDKYLPFALIAHLLKVPVLYHIRGRVRPTVKVCFFIKFASFVFISRYVKSYFLFRGAFPKNNFVIFNGRNKDEFFKGSNKSLQNIRHYLGMPSNQKLIINISTLTKGKGQRVFVKAASLICREYKNVSFLIVGDNVPYEDDIRSELLEMINKYGLEQRIFLLGQRTDIAALLSDSDISVVSSELPEALCGVNIEAMACRIPLISTNVGAIPEVVHHKKTGLLVPPGDHEAMADAIRKMLDHEKEANEMAKRGYQRFLCKFDAKQISSELQKVYQQLINKNLGP